uniref:Non-haem dioxygenase N-terminal domain-containing protein n=1 Tax=Pseudo-nitzschia australis TaxID=44445 RepID=A0A7S4AGM1_9STRA|mmetsp:Transcript_1/g.5  ORF Transcript_1/g.5 Transcript_1/m.5 type:complete len:436 (+) Transcript_1:164-1471(+)
MSVIRSTSRRIPILDIAKYHSNRTAFVEELRVACHTVGFFLIKHDFGDLARTMLGETTSFFERPLEQKLSISYENSPSFRGFMKLGVENTSGRMDYREQVEYAVEYNTTKAGTTATQPFYERLKGKNPWPTDFQPTLEPITNNYASEVCNVADIIRDSLCLALKLDPKDTIHDKFLAPTDNSDSENDVVPHWVIKLVSYPPPAVIPTQHTIDRTNEPSSHEEQQHQGVGAHTDTNFLTLVLQDDSSGSASNNNNNTSEGLQAYSRGEWIDVDVPSSPSAVPDSSTTNENDASEIDSSSGTSSNNSSNFLICNLGEQAETWSRGYFLATPHRVITKSSSPSSQQQKPRTSVPLFYNPVLSATMGPLDHKVLDKVPWERPKKYQQQEHWRRPNNLMNPSVGENTFKSLARSHPEVFAKHHPDLELLEDGRIILRGST